MFVCLFFQGLKFEKIGFVIPFLGRCPLLVEGYPSDETILTHCNKGSLVFFIIFLICYITQPITNTPALICSFLKFIKIMGVVSADHSEVILRFCIIKSSFLKNLIKAP